MCGQSGELHKTGPTQTRTKPWPVFTWLAGHKYPGAATHARQPRTQLVYIILVPATSSR